MNKIRLNWHGDTKIEIDCHFFSFEPGQNDEVIKDNIRVRYFGDDDDFQHFSPTLKDISIIMHTMVGHGVTWQLANELSKRFKLNPYEVSENLSEIFEEYYNISEDESDQRWESKENPSLYAPMT